ncbi:neprilysin-4 [Drosophila montana]|uniref:neprilysin-4 n=1 Tax=Drosophila montana TaxID=40370 RepID=UPI00313B8F15
MLKLSLIAWLLCSLAWRTTPTSCRQTRPAASIQELLANQLQSYMDTKARPCENFYQYACGNWQLQQEEHTQHTQHKAQQQQQQERQQHYQQKAHREQHEQLQPSDTLAVLDYALNRQLELLLRRGVANETSGEEQPLAVHEKMRNYYRACKRLKPYNLKKYLQLLQPGNGTSWPLLSRSWQPEKFNWLATIGRLRLFGLNGVLLKEQVLPRWDDAGSYSIYLDKPSLTETMPMGEGAMIELLLDIGQTKRVANELARQVDAFERQLHRLQELEDDEGAKEMQLGYLAEYMPQLQWLAYMQQLRATAAGYELDLLSTLIIQNLPYMRALDELLQHQKPETICNYIMLKLLAFLKQQGPAEISRVECMASLRRAMPLAASLLIGQRFHDSSSEPLVSDIFSRLKLRFGQLLSENRLQLQQPIVQVLRDKLQAMRLQLGFVQLNDSSFVEEYYEPVELNAHSFYGNQLALLRLRVEQNHELLLGSAQSDANNVSYLTEHWLSSSSSPFYVKPRNLVLVPYGLLQLPVWHRNMSELQQNAVLGFTLAHELIHGFDSSGIDYDSVGNIMGPSEEISANPGFVQGLNCMQQQLATGSRSLNEKLADYEALRLVYETFFGADMLIDRREPRDPLLPQFSQRQRFFISFAQFFCGKLQSLSLHAQHLEHAVDELRVLQTLANFEEFSREFGCERRTKMQATEKCRVW